MWKISQVEAITGLPRRDIQRACEPDGDVSIVQVKDSTHGRRFFDRDEVLQLYLVKQFKDMGYNLKQVKGVFESAETPEQTIPNVLEQQILKLEEQKALVERQLRQAEDLRDVFNGQTLEDSLFALLLTRFFSTFLASLSEHFNSLLPDDEAVDFEEEVHAALGVGFDGLGKLPLESWYEAMGADPVEERVIGGYVSRVEALVASGASPDSDGAQRIIEEVMGIVGFDGGSPWENDIVNVTLLESALDAMGDADFRFLLELCFEAGSADFLEAAIQNHLVRRVEKMAVEAGLSAKAEQCSQATETEEAL